MAKAGSGRWGRKTFSEHSREEEEKPTSGEDCKRANHRSTFAPHHLLLMTGGTKPLPVSDGPLPIFTLLGSANTGQPAGHLPLKASLWEDFISFWNMYCEERW